MNKLLIAIGCLICVIVVATGQGYGGIGRPYYYRPAYYGYGGYRGGGGFGGGGGFSGIFGLLIFLFIFLLVIQLLFNNTG